MSEETAESSEYSETVSDHIFEFLKEQWNDQPTVEVAQALLLCYICDSLEDIADAQKKQTPNPLDQIFSLLAPFLTKQPEAESAPEPEIKPVMCICMHPKDLHVQGTAPCLGHAFGLAPPGTPCSCSGFNEWKRVELIMKVFCDTCLHLKNDHEGGVGACQRMGEPGQACDCAQFYEVADRKETEK